MTANRHSREEVLKCIFSLSYRISRYSPPMKPFIRFSKQETSRLFWDFDDALQKVLLNAVRKIASPKEITHLFIEQWKSNLKGLYKGNKRALEAARNKTETNFRLSPRDEFIMERIKPRGRLLYIGCGCGTECLRFAQNGFHVVGIDTDPNLTDIANGWAEYLNLPFKAICTDLMNPDVEPGAFDSFLLEFYGSWPSLHQTMTVQRNLAGMLNTGGRGVVVGNRKKYTSFWFMMGSPYSAPMTKWLMGQALSDHFSEPDGCEERLQYGLYNRSHTTKSLSSELSRMFDVSECLYEKHDPRYVIAVVEQKARTDHLMSVKENDTDSESERRYSEQDMASATDIVSKAEFICNMLESHTREVSWFFDNAEKSLSGNPLSSVKTDLSEFTDILREVIKK